MIASERAGRRAEADWGPTIYCGFASRRVPAGTTVWRVPFGGSAIIQLAVDDWLLDKLMTFDTEAAELEDGGGGEPDADDEEDGPPVVVEVVRAKLIGCG